MVGGLGDGGALDAVERLDCRERAPAARARRWEKCPALLQSRQDVAAAFVRQSLVAVGGEGAGAILASAEVFEPQCRAGWRPLPSMRAGRRNFGLAVMGYDAINFEVR